MLKKPSDLSLQKSGLVLCGSIALLALQILPSRCFAQANMSNIVKASNELPDAPGRELGSQVQREVAAVSAVLSGTVTDANGSPVHNSRVCLMGSEARATRTATTDAEGRYEFTNLAPGTYRLTIDANGLQVFNSDAIVLASGETKELPAISLGFARANTEVQVVASSTQIAQAQIQLAEKQRVLGIVPNFYSSYIWDAAPLTPELKFGLAFRSISDPAAFLLAGGVAGVEHSHNTFPGYGSGPEGYAKRYGAAYADNVIGRMVGSALLPSVFHQDPRYFYKGRGSIKSRALYAIGATFIARGDNGHLQPNYSHILGNFAAAGISNLYRTQGDRSVTLTIRNGFIIIGTNAIGNVVREFFLKSLTMKVPAFAQGQP